MKRGFPFIVLLITLAAVVLTAVALSSSHKHIERVSSHGGRSTAATTTTTTTQLWHCGMHPQVIQDHPGDCPICHMALTPIGGTGGTRPVARKILYWWDPMLGPSSISQKPGKSAMGMDLVPVYAESAGPDVRIDPRVVQNMGVRTAEVTKGTLRKTVRTVGILSLPEPGLHDVSLRVSGWVEKLYANQEGMHVTKGEPLFEIYSPELQVAAQELIGAARALRSLPADAADGVRSDASRMVDSAKRKLRLWGVGDAEVDAIAAAAEPPRTVVFRSPATGHVEEKRVVEGASVQQGTKLLRIADHTTMWLDLQVYEGQLPFVKAGEKVTATVAGVAGKTFTGTVTFLYPHLDHASRTLRMRATLDNPDFALRPGMYATAEIGGQPVADATLVPREAVIDTGTRQIAFVAEGGGHFAPRKVRTGLVGDDDKVQILEGLVPGERVVVSGQFLMDVESRTIEATQKFGETAAGTAAADTTGGK